MKWAAAPVLETLNVRFGSIPLKNSVESVI